MFQNIDVKSRESTVNTTDNNYNKGKNEIFNSIIGQVFTKQNIVLYIIAFMLSMVSAGDGIVSFSMPFFAAACSNLIPVMFIYVITMIGTAIKFGSAGLLTYILTSLLFIAMILIFKPWYEEEYKNERRKLGKYVFLSTIIIQFIQMFFSEILIYNILLSIARSISAYIFYKIFAESISVINEWDIKKAFSIEEIVGACLMVSIALLSLNNTSLFGLNIGQIIMIVIILVLGWKNGIMVGATAGITIGTVVGIIGNAEPILIASFALSGMLAGLLNRFGKIGVILGFMIGNAILTFIYNGNTVAVVYFKEIIVASLALLLVPKDVKININDLFDKSTALPEGAIYKLDGGTETASKLNSVSNLIHEISNTYNPNKKNKEIDSKEIFSEEIEKRLELIENNVLYEDIINDYNNGIINETYNILKEKQKISEYDLQEIFQKHNAYIFSLDSDTNLEKVEEDTKEIVKIINEAYKVSKINYMWSKKVNDDKRVISNQLENVSEAIEDIANDISKENNFKNETIKIKILAQNKKIKILDINIKKKENKYIVNLYTEICKENCYVEEMQQILSDVLKDDIILQRKECGIDLNNNLCKQIYASKDKFTLRVGIAKKTKDKSVVSGDTYIKTTLDDGKILVALSDGMGSGNDAKKCSQTAMKMLKSLLKNGFEKDVSLKLINNTMCLNSKDDMYSTLDISIFDLYKGNVEIVKNGSCPTYIKSKNNVQMIKSVSLPAGILDNVDLVTYDRDLEDNDILVMCSDGIMDANREEKEQEKWIKNILEDISTDDVNRIANIILHEAVDSNYGKANDDMTVIVTKIKKNEEI